MSTDVAPPWERKRTDESRGVEEALGRAGFAQVDAYRHNAASLRVRVIDERFRGVSREARDRMIEPALDALDPRTAGDIINLLLIYPGEERDTFRVRLFNEEFEKGESNL